MTWRRSTNSVEVRSSKLKIAAPDSANRGEVVDVSITIADSAGEIVPAVIPRRVDITDPAGRPAEFSGFHGVKNRTLKLPLDIATNDTPGV